LNVDCAIGKNETVTVGYLGAQFIKTVAMRRLSLTLAGGKLSLPNVCLSVAKAVILFGQSLTLCQPANRKSQVSNWKT